MARGEHDVCAGDRGAADEEPSPPRAIPVCGLGTDCGDCGERD